MSFVPAIFSVHKIRGLTFTCLLGLMMLDSKLIIDAVDIQQIMIEHIQQVMIEKLL